MAKQIDLEEITVEKARHKYPHGYVLNNELIYFDDIRQIQFPIEAVRTQCFFFAVCTQGSASYIIDTQRQNIVPGDFIIITENQVISETSLSDDCQGIAFLISAEFFYHILSGIQNLSYLFVFSRFHPVFKVDRQMLSELLTYGAYLKSKISDYMHPYRRELVATLFKALIYDMGSIMYRYQQEETGKLTRGEIIFSDFIAAVQKHFKEERRVSWYAEKLCITSKYLSEVVKSISKRKPSEWIDSYVILELRVLLRNSNLTIKEISERLHFANQSFMGKYFRERVGVSPSAFRKGE